MRKYATSLIFVIIGNCFLFSFSYGSGILQGGTRILSDLNGNGKVDLVDYSTLANDWGKTGANSIGDISGPNGIPDKAVDWHDLNAFSEDYLKTAFLMSSHKSDDERLYIWESLDGRLWSLRGENPVYENPNLPHNIFPPHYENKQNVVRDPSIMEYNGKYYIVYTTNNKPCHYCGDTFGVACSDDLVNWQYIMDVDMTVLGTVYSTWAPEWFVDDDGSIHVFVALRLSGQDFKIYETHPTNEDFTVWHVPVEVTGNLPLGIIDAFMLRVNDTYYLWYKSSTRHIEYATSNSLTSNYIVQESGDWAGWGDTVEGESIVKIDDNIWRIYFDKYVDQGIYYSESSDNFNTWTTKQLINSEEFIPAHPTVIRRK